MKNNRNGSMSAAAEGTTGGMKTYLKTTEGRYKLHVDKSHPSSLLPSYSLSKTPTQITVAQLKERHPQATTSAPSSSYSTTSGVRYVTSKFLGSGNGNRTLSFVGGNGSNKANGGTRSNPFAGLNGSGSSSLINSNYDGKGTYLIFNVGDTLYVSDPNSQDKDPVKAIHFSNSNPVCHAFDSEANDGHDLLIGLNCGDVYSVSLRQQLQDVGKKLVGAQHYNKDGPANNRCTSVGWIPGRDGVFVVAHADGNLYVYEKNKDVAGDTSFPVIKDLTQCSVSHAKSSKSNPIARWHICLGPVNSVAFSTDGKYLATVGRDGYLRVFDYATEQLICGGKSYYGSLLCCTWSGDGKYVLTGGEDDLVQVWSMEDRKIVAWGEGHNSWVSAVCFDPYWLPPSSEEAGENVMYRFGSVGQDAQLLLWDLSMDELVVPLRRCPPSSSPTFSTRGKSSHWDSAVPVGTLQPPPSMRDVPKLAPVVAHRVHFEPLSGLIFTQESIITSCREGHVKIWSRPGNSEQSSGSSETISGSNLKEKTILSSKVGGNSYK